MKTPELKTERLILLPYTPDRVTQQHVDWLNDPEVVKFSQQRHLSHDIYSQRDYVEEASELGHIWLVATNLGAIIAPVGTVSVRIDHNNQVGDMGILIGNKLMWRNGYATEAWKEVMRWCFDELKLRKIECGCMSPNLGMRQLAVKTGMRIEGGKVSHFLLDGKPVDAVYYGKMRE